MQIKNKIIILTLILFLQNHNLLAEEFNISASEISFDKENNILFGKGSVEVSDDEGKIIKSDKVTYTKDKEYLLLEGTVSFLDLEGNII